MFCPQCGREYTQKVNFCCHCGAAMFTPARPSNRKLTLSRRDKKIAGVCGGFAEYLEIDPTLVRLLWVALIFFGGWGVIAYLVAWIVMPQESEPRAEVVAAPPAAPQPAPNH
jgi:phage shock protein C